MGPVVIEPALDLDRRVQAANRSVYNRKTVEDYDGNESIFNPQQARVGINVGEHDFSTGEANCISGCQKCQTWDNDQIAGRKHKRCYRHM